MNIICINKHTKYVINGVYTYDENDTVDGIDLKYNLYTREGNHVDIVSKDFIKKNFVTLFEYNRVMHEVDKMYSNYFNCLIGR